MWQWLHNGPFALSGLLSCLCGAPSGHSVSWDSQNLNRSWENSHISILCFPFSERITKIGSKKEHLKLELLKENCYQILEGEIKTSLKQAALGHWRAVAVVGGSLWIMKHWNLPALIIILSVLDMSRRVTFKNFILMEAFLITWELDYSLLNLVIAFEQKSV